MTQLRPVKGKGEGKAEARESDSDSDDADAAAELLRLEREDAKRCRLAKEAAEERQRAWEEAERLREEELAARYPGLTTLESDEFQRRLLETFHEAAQEAGADPDAYLEYGLKGLYAVQDAQVELRPKEGTALPPYMRKNEQRIAYLGHLAKYLNPRNQSGRWGVESFVPVLPWSTEPAMVLTGCGCTGVCNSSIIFSSERAAG